MRLRMLLGIVALGALTLAGSLVLAHERGRSERSMGGMQGMTEMMQGMHGMPGSVGQGGMMGGMTRGMHGPMRQPSQAERPLISLALQHGDQLGLSAEQVQRLEALRSDFRKEAIRRSADVQIAELELRELLRQDPVDLVKVEAALRKLEGLRTELRLTRLKAIEQGKAVLTPEQRQKLETLTRQPAAPERRAETPPRDGMTEMRRFMGSERMPRAMAAMMEMARRMGDGDVMLGMTRMMEMMGRMGSMGGMMGGPGGPSGEPE